jgi:hypothetical protein
MQVAAGSDMSMHLPLVTLVSHSQPLWRDLNRGRRAPDVPFGHAPTWSNRWTSKVVRNTAGSGSQGLPFGDVAQVAWSGACKTFLTDEDRAESGAKDRYAINGSHAVSSGKNMRKYLTDQYKKSYRQYAFSYPKLVYFLRF